MNNNQIVAGLTGIFTLCAVVTFFNVWNYHAALRQLAETEAKVIYVRNVKTPMMVSLLNDTLQYSKKNPAVLPILQEFTNHMNMGRQVVQKPAN